MTSEELMTEDEGVAKQGISGGIIKKCPKPTFKCPDVDNILRGRLINRHLTEFF
jgi:hypothetical protein